MKIFVVLPLTKALSIFFICSLSFLFGKNNDTIKTFYQNKNIESLEIREKKRIHVISYYEFGGLRSDMILTKDSVPISIIKYMENGELSFIQSKKECVIYNRKTAEEMHFQLKNGLRHGKAKTYLNGKLSYEMTYKNDIATGEAIGYDTTSQGIIAKENYENGKLNGESLYFSKGNILQRKITYENGCPKRVRIFDIHTEVVYETTDQAEIEDKFRSTRYCN